MATDILSPEGQSGGNLLSPGHGSVLPHGLVWPHGFPKPEDFRLPEVAIPSASKALVSSHITSSPAASGGPGKLLSQGLGLIDVAKPQRPQRPVGLISGARGVSRNAIGAVTKGVQRFGGNIGLKGRGIRPLGIRWG